MLETFYHYFSLFAGCTAGICIILVPLLLIGYLASQIYGSWLKWQFEKRQTAWIEQQMKQQQEPVGEEDQNTMSTPRFV